MQHKNAHTHTVDRYILVLLLLLLQLTTATTNTLRQKSALADLGRTTERRKTKNRQKYTRLYFVEQNFTVQGENGEEGVLGACILVFLALQGYHHLVPRARDKLETLAKFAGGGEGREGREGGVSTKIKRKTKKLKGVE